MVTIQVNDRQFFNIRAVIFDKDGTLENSAQFWWQVGQRRSRLVDAQIPGVGAPLLLAYGYDGDRLDPQGLMAVGSRRENLIATAAYIAETGRSWAQSMAIAEQCFQEVETQLQPNPTTAPLFPDVRPLLQHLQDGGLSLAIASADTTANISHFLQGHRLGPQFPHYVGSDRTYAKPDPRLYETLCTGLGVSPAETLMVGDSEGDFSMAKGAGAQGAIAINRQRGARFLGCDCEIETFAQIQVLPTATSI